MSSRFKKVYYIFQTKPIFKLCGYCFDSTEADIISNYVKEITGATGKVVEFTREELVELNF